MTLLMWIIALLAFPVAGGILERIVPGSYVDVVLEFLFPAPVDDEAP